MSWGRALSSFAAALAVGGCAVLVIGMSRAASTPDARATHPSSSSAPTPHVTFAPGTVTGVPVDLPADPQSRDRVAPHPGPRSARPSVAAVPPTSSVRPAPAAPALTSPPAPRPAVTSIRPPTRVAARPAPGPKPAPKPKAKAKAKPKPAARHRGATLPLHYSTGSATRVITVVAASHGSTTARLQAWTKASGGGWRKYGGSVTAHVGSQGLTAHPSESRSATPIGSFTLTQAFGYYANPGTHLHYFKTTSSDYWISDGGAQYNTHQRCGSCGYNDGVNERLEYETPYYNYAVVIDYNTRNAPGGVHQGAGSAFFLHVTDGHPTAGCVSIPQSRLVPLLRWLTPSAHPRIVIGVS